MQILPIKTKLFYAPQDDLLSELSATLTDLKDGDIVAISSKVVAIHEGNCVAQDTVDKKQLVEKEAEFVIPRDYWPSPLTVKHHAFIGTAGVDASNANGYFVLLPEKPFESAHVILKYLREQFGLQNIGVLITDSHSIPMRRGAVGVSIGFAGFAPTKDLVGTKDLFGREFKVEVANLADSIAAAANLVMGEGSECQPVAVVRGLNNLEFTDRVDVDYFMVPYREDTFRVLYERFLE
jgi:coenzyme F420-0:L-glutamate ligase